MKLHGFALNFAPSLVSSLTGGCLWLMAPGWITPAQAGEITTWHYDDNQLQFQFATDADVQPRAQLVFDPARLVIDLPGMQLDQPITQEIGGTVQRIRIGQFDAQTARIVIELAPGYTLDPQQVRFRGFSPTQWLVQLPQPSAQSAQPFSSSLFSAASPAAPSSAAAPAPAPAPAQAPTGPSFANPSFATPSFANPAPSRRTSSSSQSPAPSPGLIQTPPAPGAASQSRQSPPASQSASPSSRSSWPASQATQPQSTPSAGPIQISAVQVTDEGLLINTQGANTQGANPQAANPQVTIDRSRSGRSITVRLANAQLANGLREGDRSIDRHGVDEIEISQERNAVEITLDVARRSPDWQVSRQRNGLLLLPVSTVAAEKTADPVPPNTIPSARRATPPAVSSPSPTAGLTVAEQPSPARVTAPTPPRTQLATVEGIELDLSGNQLLIQTDRPVAHSAQWQGGVYVLTLSPAQLANRVSGPQLSSTDPLRRVTLRQTDDTTVTVSVQPTTGVQFGNLNLITPQTLALELQRSSTTANRPNRVTLPNLSPTGRMVVVLDPGHGGGDPGAVGQNNLHEADVVLPIAQQVATLLQQQGIQAVLTRTSDVEIDLEPRVDMAEQLNASLFVSIHANSMGMDRPDINGTETYYYSSGEALAETIQNSIVSNVDTNDRGIRQARFYVLRRTSMPAVLIETGYVTGTEDAPRLASPTFQTQMATAIARGILLYLQQQSLTGSR
ncbi:MAG: N-acetylmuramoyl-L-alanine amidase [Elainella sp.]